MNLEFELEKVIDAAMAPCQNYCECYECWWKEQGLGDSIDDRILKPKETMSDDAVDPTEVHDCATTDLDDAIPALLDETTSVENPPFSTWFENLMDVKEDEPAKEDDEPAKDIDDNLDETQSAPKKAKTDEDDAEMPKPKRIRHRKKTKDPTDSMKEAMAWLLPTPLKLPLLLGAIIAALCATDRFLLNNDVELKALHCVEVFSGVGAIVKGFRGRGYDAEPFDIRNNKDEDFNTPQGFIRCLQLIRRLHPKGLLHFGIPCCTWVATNRGTSGRTERNPVGQVCQAGKHPSSKDVSIAAPGNLLWILLASGAASEFGDHAHGSVATVIAINKLVLCSCLHGCLWWSISEAIAIVVVRAVGEASCKKNGGHS